MSNFENLKDVKIKIMNKLSILDVKLEICDDSEITFIPWESVSFSFTDLKYFNIGVVMVHSRRSVVNLESKFNILGEIEDISKMQDELNMLVRALEMFHDTSGEIVLTK